MSKRCLKKWMVVTFVWKPPSTLLQEVKYYSMQISSIFKRRQDLKQNLPCDYHEQVLWKFPEPRLKNLEERSAQWFMTNFWYVQHAHDLETQGSDVGDDFWDKNWNGFKCFPYIFHSFFHFWPPQQADGRSNGDSRECHDNALRTMRKVGRGLKQKGIHPAPIRSTAAANLSEGKSHREWMHGGGDGSGGRNIGWTTVK